MTVKEMHRQSDGSEPSNFCKKLAIKKVNILNLKKTEIKIGSMAQKYITENFTYASIFK